MERAQIEDVGNSISDFRSDRWSVLHMSLFPIGPRLSDNANILPGQDKLIIQGRWGDFTAGRLRALIEWSMAKPERHFTLDVCDIDRKQAATDGPAVSHSFPIGVSSGGDFLEVNGTATRHVTQDEFESRLSGPAAFSALVITGHGAEHCISFGPKWVMTDTGYGLAGQPIYPTEIHVPIVFLNGCSSLRMADSVVPAHRSVAACLLSDDRVVLGPFRNVRGSCELEKVFVDLALAGCSVGQITQELNRTMCHSVGEIPCIISIGDASRHLPEGRIALTEPDLPLKAAPDWLDLVDVTQDVSSILRICRNLKAWAWQPRHLEDQMSFLEQAIDAGRRAVALSDRSDLLNEERRYLKDYLKSVGEEAIAKLLDDIVVLIASGRWVQSIYAPCTERNLDWSGPCQAGCAQGAEHEAGLVVDYRFDDPAGEIPPVFARECDRCGSVAEWLQDAPPLPIQKIDRVGDHIVVKLDELDVKDQGRILIHRAADMAPKLWPKCGAEVVFDFSESDLRGRITVVAVSAGPGGLATRYAHLFRNPSTGEFD